MSKNIIDYLEQDKINEKLLLKSLVKGLTNAGSPYFSMTLQDKTGTIEAKLWDASGSDIDENDVGMIIEVNGEVLKYRNSLQLRVNKMYRIDNDSLDLSEYVTSSPIPTTELREFTYSRIEKMNNSILKEIVEYFFKKVDAEYFVYPAASKNHHEFVGGLATHVLGMTKLADFLCDMYPSLNRDLLVAGILLHDIGKIDELSGPILTSYTVKGKLLGHISIMQANIELVATKLGYQNSEEVLLLKHLILSHHGQYEFGSPVLPMLPEAECLNFIDNLDSRINMLEKALANVEPGEFSSRIFSLENRAFYKSKI